ncbi:excinuclease ABC subunit C, partial [Candidatus Gracilibacteria bacterium]|nr:excinuclease ABC subunit C [Candidatus Gracilibacteria bacterium]
NHTVASRSVIQDGKLNKQKYRKFKIKNLEEQKIDDFGSMKEVTQRRIKEIQKSGEYPDLIIIDGGKGQLSSVVEIYESSEIGMPQIVSIAKREEELFLPGVSDPIVLEKDSVELKLLQKLRDEAHRFAITFNRDSRSKALKKNILEEIPGIGPKTRKKILEKYKDIETLGKSNKQEVKDFLGNHIYEVLENHGII